MQRAIVIGCPGAGKSVFARRLRDLTGLPLHHLDMLWHRPDRTNISREAFDRQLQELMRGERWIIDGTYLRTLELRLQACDTVFFLDYPMQLCLAGAQARVGQPREDMPWTQTQLDDEFRQWILDFPTAQRPQICQLLTRCAGDKTIVVFKSRQEAEDYLQGRSL